jgi:hypothetical protein
MRKITMRYVVIPICREVPRKSFPVLMRRYELRILPRGRKRKSTTICPPAAREKEAADPDALAGISPPNRSMAVRHGPRHDCPCLGCETILCRGHIFLRSLELRSIKSFKTRIQLTFVHRETVRPRTRTNLHLQTRGSSCQVSGIKATKIT